MTTYGILSDMKPRISAIRTIAAITFRQIFFPIVVIAGLVAVILTIVIVIAAHYLSPWWLVFLLPLGLAVIFGGVVGLALWSISSLLVPKTMTKTETVTVKAFVGKLLGLAEVRSTPLPLVAFYIGKDVVRRRKSAYLTEIIQSSSTLRGDFERIVDMFR